MTSGELPLVVYTVLLQMAVGAFITIEAIRFFSRKKSWSQDSDVAANGAVYAFLVIAIVGLLASFLHLKVPMHAPFALANAGVSWMSREIWATLFFVGLLAIYSVVLFRKVKSQAVKRTFAAVTLLAGLVLVYCMSCAYMMPAFPAWDSVTTPIAFYATTFLLGAMFAVAALAVSCRLAGKKAPESAGSFEALLGCALKWVAVVAAIALAVETVTATLHLSELALGGIPAAVQSAGYLVGEYGVLFGVRLVLAFASVGAVGAALYENAVRKNQQAHVDAWVIGAFALILVSELVGRYLFYASAVSIGL